MQSERFLIAGERYKGKIRYPDVIWIPDNPYVDERLAGHADLSVFYCGGEVLYCSEHLKDTEFPLNKRIIAVKQGEKYPNDVSFNACAVGGSVILNKRYFSGEIAAELESAGKCLIDVNQGYAKCCTLVVDEHSVITADSGIYAAAVKNGLDALKIEPGHIELEGFDYGFIGGCGFRMDERTFCFTGRLDSHPDCEEIISYINKRGLDISYMSDSPVFDIGAVSCRAFCGL